ncbi:hypothetical protein NDU88_003460 [Pleurodeles waltl]|uniref:Uncharacterized protein n=1 Tax=Pleurodeles waltl TaxID=8319 RepID=A0AAV7RGN6_PLEWA|nr:hypothetical protein NDU88_003460 [Pleurodeles waltl]
MARTPPRSLPRKGNPHCGRSRGSGCGCPGGDPRCDGCRDEGSGSGCVWCLVPVGVACKPLHYAYTMLLTSEKDTYTILMCFYKSITQFL